VCNPEITNQDFIGNLLEFQSLKFIKLLTQSKQMKKLTLTILSGVTAFALSNCAAPTGPNTQRGAVTGGLLGLAAGGILGHQSGNALEGAALGGAAGAGAGALYGNSQDQQNYNRGY